MRTLLLIISLCAIGISARAQNIRTSTISWHITQAFDINTGTTTDVADTMISTTTSQLAWKKADGSSILFTVSEVIGQWDDVAQNGEIVYEAGNGNLRGTVTFVRSGGSVRIRLIMTGDVPSFYELTVSGYELQ